MSDSVTLGHVMPNGTNPRIAPCGRSLAKAVGTPARRFYFFNQKNAPCKPGADALPSKWTPKDAGQRSAIAGVVNNLRTPMFGNPSKNATQIRALVGCLSMLNRN